MAVVHDVFCSSHQMMFDQPSSSPALLYLPGATPLHVTTLRLRATILRTALGLVRYGVAALLADARAAARAIDRSNYLVLSGVAHNPSSSVIT